jgi:DNA-binding response OmpR family regulator
MQESISVLIVDDEDVWARNLQLNLQDFGFKIAGVISTAEGALYAFENTKFDIALLDIHLEKRNSGIELGKLLNTKYKKPFIFVTASYDTHGRREAAEAFPSAYLTKPVNSSSLFIAIQNAIHNFRSQHTPQAAVVNYERTTSFFVKEQGDYKEIDWSGIAYLSSQMGITKLFNATDHTEYPIRSSLYNALRYIIPANMQHLFLQLNDTDAVQLAHITGREENTISTAFRDFEVHRDYSEAVNNTLDVLT